jgi:hypothetical protein
VNQGKPSIAATAKLAEFQDHAIPAKEAGAPYHPAANRGETEQHGNEQAARPENSGPRPGQENNITRPENSDPMRSIQTTSQPESASYLPTPGTRSKTKNINKSSRS